MKVEFEDFTVEYHVQYGRGKKISIEMDSSGFVTVKAPNNTRQVEIVQAIKYHEKTIKARQAKIARAKDLFRQKSYEDQGKFLHLGREYFLEELITTKALSEEELKISLKAFYIRSCKKNVNERVKLYQDQLRVKAKSIEVDESTINWGTCSSKKVLTFNYRLAMASIEVIDYVVVHELCHLLHMNHDRSFWRKVGSILPDYKKRQEDLQRYGPLMKL